MVLPCVEPVDEEQRREEHDLVHEERPHAEDVGFLLLPDVFELFVDNRSLRVGCFVRH